MPKLTQKLKKILKWIYLAILLFFILFSLWIILYRFSWSDFLSFLNKNTGATQAITTAILVVVTAFYAFFTYRMERVANKQITSNIQVSEVRLKSRLKDESFDPQKVSRRSIINFKLYLDIYNKSAGSGSIEKPILILTFGNYGEWRVLPVRKKYTGSEERSIRSHIIARENFYEDLGGTIYLKGGDYKKEELKYKFETDEESSNIIKKHLNKLTYSIEYKNNLGKPYRIEIKNVTPLNIS